MTEKVAIGSSSGAVVTSAHAGCERFRGTGPIITGQSRRNLAIWNQVATGLHTLLEVDGLPTPDDPGVDFELVGVVEALLDELFGAGFNLTTAKMSDSGDPNGRQIESSPKSNTGDPLVAVLATRNRLS